MKLSLLLLATFLYLVQGREEFLSISSAATQAEIEKLINNFAISHHLPCLVAGYTIIGNGSMETEVLSSRGFADLENSVPCGVNTVMKVASVSKAIGSGLVARLVEQGKLHWDDDVNKHVPESVFPKKTFKGENVTITLRQLITHTSGLRTVTEADLMHDWEFRITNSTQTVAFFARDPLLFKPGTAYAYSNSGWNLIGAIVEAVEKRSYHLVIREYMHKLGMIHSLMDTRAELVPHRASNYEVVKDKTAKGFHYQPAPLVDITRPVPHWPCGGVLSTVDDLLVYGRAVLNSYHNRSGGFLKRETLASMWNYKSGVKEGPVDLTVAGVKYGNLPSRYTMGWERIDFPVETRDASLSKLTILYHDGALVATNSLVMIIPEKNLVVAAITNTGGIGELLPGLGASVYHRLANAK